MDLKHPLLFGQNLASAIATHVGRNFGCPRSQSVFEKCKRKNWTSELHAILREVGHQERTRVLPGRGNADGSQEETEFLYDHVWLDEAQRMVLAAEIELSRYEHRVMYDFRKLLYAKSSTLKLCIFSDHPDTKSAVSTMEAELHKHRQYVLGEHFFVIRLCNWQTEQLEAFHACSDGSPRTELTRVASLPWKHWP